MPDPLPTPNGGGTEQQQQQSPANPAPATGGQQQPAADEHTRELDRLRNQAGQEKKARETAEARLAEIENASKTELQKLQERAAKADQLEADNKRFQTVLTAEVDARKSELPEALRDLLPAGTPDQQLDWIRKASGAAAKLAPAGQQQQQQLPAAGGRNPAGGAAGSEGAIKKDAAIAAFPALRRRRID